MLSKFLPVVFFTMVSFALSSCNGNNEGAGAEKTSSDTAATTTLTADPVPASTIITTPQSILMVKHKVANFAKWKASYDAHDSMRLSAGLHNYVIGRGVDDSNMVMVAVKADDMAKAKAFTSNASLKAAMQKGGVTSKPSFYFLTASFQDTVLVNSSVRSLTTSTVKDWDAWVKGFTEGMQERIENGITDRVYGHDADNDKKVMLVTAILDSAKAAAYWNSDMLKKRRAASGVIGVPERFMFRIVQRY